MSARLGEVVCNCPRVTGASRIEVVVASCCVHGWERQPSVPVMLSLQKNRPHPHSHQVVFDHYSYLGLARALTVNVTLVIAPWKHSFGALDALEEGGRAHHSAHFVKYWRSASP